MTAAETLRRAADHLEQRAAPMSGETWSAVENYPDAYVVRTNGGPRGSFYVAAESGSGDVSEPDARWIATLGPQVAAPLAAWLRGHADYCDAVPVTPEPNALALARAILGEQA